MDHTVTTRPGARIETLDILRGIAILGILYMNIPWMGSAGMQAFVTGDPRLLGWSDADRLWFNYGYPFIFGTQRGMLELLFGATAVILTARIMDRSGPVEVADIYFRRAFWLMIFGVLHGTLFLWYGEIWFAYSLVALPLFLFRRWNPRKLLIGGLVGLALFTGLSLPSSIRGVSLYDRVETINVLPAGSKLTEEERKDLAEWTKIKTSVAEAAKEYDGETKARLGGYASNLAFSTKVWMQFNIAGEALPWLIEAISTMLIGMGLFKIGFLQGKASRRTYWLVLLFGYGIGLAVRIWAFGWSIRHGFPPVELPTFGQFTRLGVSLGHVAAVCLVVRSELGGRMLGVFKAAGRMPMTVYLGHTLICCWLLFPGFGLGLLGRYGQFELVLVATAINAGLVIFCNLWMRGFTMGPAEWLWRWLSYLERPAFRKAALAA